MSKKWLSAALIAIFVVFGFASNGSVVSAQPLTFRYGHVAPPLQVMGKTSSFFKWYVEMKTQGAVKFELYPLGQLGGERALLDQVLAGTLDMANVGAPIQATVMPEFNVLCLPFVAANEDVFWDIVRTKEFREKLFGIMRKKGVEPLAFIDGCGRGLLNKKRVMRTPEDIKGLRIRVMLGPIYTDMFRAMGAKTRTIPFPEVYTALQQGLIDGEDNSADMAVMMKFTEVEKFFTNTNQTMQTNPLIVTKKSWNKLTDEQKEIFRQAGEMADAFSQHEYRYDKAEGWRIAREKYGVNVIEGLAPEEQAAFRKAVEPVLKKYRSIVGAELFDLYVRLAKEYEKKYQ